MAFTFETSGNNTFLVYAVQAEDTLDTMTLGMITNNRIPGMAPVLYSQMNLERFLKYNVTAKVTVNQFFSGVVNRRRLLGVFSSVAAALAAAQEYMIDLSSLLLDTNYIFADVSTCRAEVVCLPVIRAAENGDVGLFFKNIMFSTQFDQAENCDYVARIINYLNSTPMFVVEDFMRLLEELQGTAATAPQPVPQPVPQPIPQPVQREPERAPQPVPRPEVSAPVQPPPGKAAPSQSGSGGFAVPGQSAPGKLAEVRQEKGKKDMSMLYLLQHYSKENAAAYKAQKEARKKGGKGADSGFSVPGQTPQTPGAAQMQPQPQNPPVQPQMQPLPQNPQMQPLPQNPQMQPQQPQPQAAPVAQPGIQPAERFPSGDNFGDTVVMGAEGCGDDTVVIGAGMAAGAVRPYLRRISNNERILLDKPIFHIGKERNYVDYCITGNATISRSHADIINRNGQFFIVDNNSTNHTFVNGEMIPSNTEIPLSHGTKIRLSNEEFEFLTF